MASSEASEASAEAYQVATTQFRELAENLRRRRLLREANLALNRPDESNLKKLDSSVKRNAALVKKLRQVTEDTKDSLVEEIRRTNQSKYVAEVRSAFAEAALKARDIAAAVQVASILHQRYADFGDELALTLAQNLSSTSSDSAEADRPSFARRRTWLRLLAELHALGVGGSVAAVSRAVRTVSAAAAAAAGRDREAAQTDLAVLAAFARAAREEFLGLEPHTPVVAAAEPAGDAGGEDRACLEARLSYEQARDAHAAEVSSSYALPPDTQSDLRQAVYGAFDAGCFALIREHEALLDTEQQNLRALNSRGELPEEMAARYEAQRRTLDALHRVVATLAEALDRPLPTLEGSATTRLAGAGGVVEVLSTRETSGTAGPFDDDETRLFYESLPDVHALVPSVLLAKGGHDAKQEDSATGSPAEPSSPKSEGTSERRGSSMAEEGTVTADGSLATAEPLASIVAADASGTDAKTEVAAVLQQILGCASREAADEAALAFCHVNSKASRRKLARMLVVDPGAAQHQLPFYARIVATLAGVFPDVAALVLRSLEEEFTRLMARKDSQPRLIDERLRNARFLAELTKFRLCPYGSFFTMLKSLLDDFSGYNIETAAAMVETAGRFLLLLQETHQRMENMLEVMVKLKNTKNVDARQALAVDSAHVACRPPDRASGRRRRPPEELYMRHLLFEGLSHGTVDQVVRKLRRFPWADNERRLVKCVMSAAKGRFTEIGMLASVTASLSKYRPSFGVSLADTLLEEIRVGLDDPGGGKFQRRISHMRFLGELYNYRLMDSRTVFETLYLLLTSGHATPEDAEVHDPPTSYFRIRLACVLLSTCGQYFSKGSAGQRLDRFLAYFQRYLLYKPPLPLDVEFDVQDILAQLRPRLQRYTSFEEACRAVEALEIGAAAAPSPEGVTPEQSDSEESRLGGEGSGEEGGADGAGGVTVAPDDEDEQQVRFLRPQGAAAREVDEDFERELAAVVPASMAAVARLQGTSPGAQSLPAAGVGETVAFKVMLRKGGREDKTHAIQVPAFLALAVKSREELAADAAERAEMKRLVLQASERELDVASGTDGPGGNGHPGVLHLERGSGRHARGRGRSRGSGAEGQRRSGGRRFSTMT